MFLAPVIRPPLESAALTQALDLLSRIPSGGPGSNPVRPKGVVEIDRLRKVLPALMRLTYKTREEAIDAEGDVYIHYKGGVYRLLAEVGGSFEDPDYDGQTFVLYERLWPDPWVGVALRDRFFGTVQVEIPGCEQDEFSVYEERRFRPRAPL